MNDLVGVITLARRTKRSQNRIRILNLRRANSRNRTQRTRKRLRKTHAKTQRLSAAEPQPKKNLTQRRKGTKVKPRRIFQKLNDFLGWHCKGKTKYGRGTQKRSQGLPGVTGCCRCSDRTPCRKQSVFLRLIFAVLSPEIVHFLENSPMPSFLCDFAVLSPKIVRFLENSPMPS